MSKVICDVCGTTYPETATQCPICGTAKNSVGQTAAAATSQETGAAGYSYVKGGRFSEKNVRRRNDRSRSNERRSNDRRRKPADEEKGNIGLIIIVIILLVAIIAVVINLAVRYLGGSNSGTPEETGTTQASDSTTATSPSEDTTPSEPETVPCTDLQLSNLNIVIVGVGNEWDDLTVRTIPESTTDKVTFESADPTVATVSDTGVITVVSQGEVDIIVKCGNVTKTCHVTCVVDGGGETQPPVGEFDFEFNAKENDVTLSKAGEIWTAYKNDVSVAPELITWISDDPNVCTVENGIVTAVGPGRTEIHAEYNGVTYTCIVRCAFEEEGNGGEDEPAPTGQYHTNKESQGNDVTIKVGETFTLLLLDSNNKAVTVTWSADKAGYVSISGNKITGTASIKGYVTVSTTYEGVTYSCKVRIQ